MKWKPEKKKEKPIDLGKLERGIKEEEAELQRLEEELKYGEIANSYEITSDIAISCCQRISLSKNTEAMTIQQVIEDKILIDSIIRGYENDIEKHGRHNRHWLVKFLQKKIDSIMEAKHVWGI